MRYDARKTTWERLLKTANTRIIYPFDEKPETGAVRGIRDGLFWMRCALPFELKHINLWLIEGPDGWSIIDAGLNSPDTRAQWDAVFADKITAEKPVENILVTHFHPDHFGLAGWLAERTGVTPVMTAGEWAMVQSLTGAGSEEELEHLYRPYYETAGVDRQTLEQLIERRLGYKKSVYAPPAAVRHVHDGDVLRLGGCDWRVVEGFGHSPQHACLYNAADRIFIAGDVVLPGITPNISFFPGNPAGHDPVAGYIETLGRLRATIPDDVLVLPSHGEPFTGLHTRIDNLVGHHDKRCARIHAILSDGPKTAFETMHALFAHRQLSVSDLFFALSETLAHLVYDIRRGKVAESMDKGRILYRLP